MSKIFILVFIIFTISCSSKNEESTKEEGSARNDSILSEEESGNSVLKEFSFVEDSLASDPFSFGQDPIKSLLKFNYSRIDTTIRNNPHTDNQLDTAFTFTIGRSKIEVLKYPHIQIVSSSTISDRSIPIQKGIYIGMDKKLFFSKFHQLDTVAPETDKITISLAETEQYVDFLFEKDTLKQIEFQGYYD